MSDTDKQGSIFQEMVERRSRSEELQAKAVEQGLEVGSLVLPIDSVDDDSLEIELTPAFDMEDLTVTPVLENEIQVEGPESPVDSLNTHGCEELVIDNPPVVETVAQEAEVAASDSSSIFDELENDDLSNEDTLRKELTSEFVPIGERALPSVPEQETLAEPPSPQEDLEPEGLPAVEAAPSYFDGIVEPSEEEAVVAESESEILSEDSGETFAPAWEPDLGSNDDEVPVAGALPEPGALPEEISSDSLEIESFEPAEEEPVEAETEPEVLAEVSDEAFPSAWEPDLASVEENPVAGAFPEPEALPEEISSGSFPTDEEEESVVAPSYFNDIGEPEAEASGPVEIESEEEVSIAAESETAPIGVEDLIGASDDLLAPSPEAIEDADIIMAAEALVDRIGPVVDIQKLPKTQPTRVLSKTMKQAEEEPVSRSASSEGVKELPPSPVAKKPLEGVTNPSEDSTNPKKKKKKVSLLDSYFKGL